MKNTRPIVALFVVAFNLCSTPFAFAAAVVDYNFHGGVDGQLVSGATGGATAGTLNSSVDHPNTLIDASGSNATNGSVIKHWSDNPATETAGGNFVALTYDTSLPAGAETRAGYDGQAANFVRSGVLHNLAGVPHVTKNFTAFTRIYWRDLGLYDYETLFANSSRINQTGWWVGIDWVTKRLTWSFNSGAGTPLDYPADGPLLTPNTWTDIAVSFSGDGADGDQDSLRVYIDGVLSDTHEGMADIGTLPQSLRDDWSFWNSSTLQLGGSYRGSSPFQPEAFDGLMEKFTFFDTVLTDAQVLALTTAPVGGVGGDFDNDDDVDGNDLLIWQQGFGVGTTHGQGDADRNGVVDGSDLTIWRTQFGGPPSTSATVAIPEPASLLLSGVAVIFFKVLHAKRSPAAATSK